jgi:asparagine synthase (glutamine-hydrolysing)
MMEEVLSERAVRETGLFRAEAVARVKEAHARRRANLGYPLWGLLILFLWMKEWKIDSATAR